MIAYPVIVFILLLIVGLSKDFRYKKPKQQTYSILIACRNEEKNLPDLFSSLTDLDYPKNQYEILLIDDASNDNTLSLLQQFAYQKKNVKVIHLSKKNTEYKGKKAALKAASEVSKYDFLAFTDADCQIPTNWLSNMNSYISDKTGAVLGYYLESEMDMITKIMKFLNAGLYAATAGLNHPMSAAGGNFAVRKNVFFEVGGYELIKNHIAGDDKMLLSLIRKTKWEVSYNPSEPVITKSLKSSKERFEQRKRQYGKFQSFSFSFKIAIILSVLFYLWLPIMIFTNSKIVVLYIFTVIIFWFITMKKHKQSLKSLELLLLLIIPYIMIYYGMYGVFSGWKWKNQGNLS